MQVDNLNHFENTALNRFLLHHMGLEVRRKLMTEYPVIYRKLLGREDDEPFRAAVKEAVLGERRVHEPGVPWVVRHLDLAQSDDMCGLPYREDALSVAKSQALHEVLNTLEEDE
jgi:hypothetical protein